MNLKRSAKFGAVALAIAAPLAIGWAATAGASGVREALGFHTHDVYEIDGYSYERENVGGVVTNVITDPDGNVITVDEAPAEIVDLVENWIEPEPFETIEFVVAEDRSSACYILMDNADTGWDNVVEEYGFVAAARSTNGVLEVQYFGEVDDLDDFHELVIANTPLADIPGAQDMAAC